MAQFLPEELSHLIITKYHSLTLEQIRRVPDKKKPSKNHVKLDHSRHLKISNAGGKSFSG